MLVHNRIRLGCCAGTQWQYKQRKGATLMNKSAPLGGNGVGAEDDLGDCYNLFGDYEEGEFSLFKFEFLIIRFKRNYLLKNCCS